MCFRLHCQTGHIGDRVGNTSGPGGWSDDEKTVVHIRCRKRVRAAPWSMGASQQCREPHRQLWTADSFGRFGTPLFGHDASAQEEGI